MRLTGGYHGKVLEQANEQGIEAREAGYITPESVIFITSRGMEASGKRLRFRF